MNVPIQQTVPLIKGDLSVSDFDTRYEFSVGLTRGYHANIPPVLRGEAISKSSVQQRLKTLLDFARESGILAFRLTRGKGSWDCVLEDSITLTYCTLMGEDTDAKIVSVIERAKALFEQDCILLERWHKSEYSAYLL